MAADKTTGRLLVNATGAGGTSSTFGATFPTTGTAVGASDGTNMQPLLVDGSGNLKVNVEAGGGGGTQYTDGGTPPTHPIGNAIEWNNAGTWATSGSAAPFPVTANAGTNLNTSTLATSANLTSGTQKTQVVDGSGNVVTTDSTTTTSTVGLDMNIRSILNTAPTTAGFLDIKGADGNVFVRQATAANLLATVNNRDGAGNALTTNSTTYTAKFALDGNLLGTLGTAFTTAGLVDIKGTDGNVFVRQATGTNLHVVTDSTSTTAVTQATASNLNAQVVGVAASGASVTGNPVQIAGLAKTALPTAVSDGQVVEIMQDKFGRQIVLPQGSRDLAGFQTTTFTATTGSSTVLTGVSNIFADITSIVLANSGATATTFLLSDGTNIYTYYIPAGDMRGATYQVPLAATTVATNWTANCGSSTSSLICTITYVKNR